MISFDFTKKIFRKMIHLEDNFFEDPYSVRSSALKSKYSPAYDYTWPGYRSWDVPDDVSDQIRSRVRSVVGDSSLDFKHAQVNNNQSRVYPNSSFQYTTEEFGDGLFHHDEDLYICIVYLSLDAPSDSGTEICDGDQGPAYFLDNSPSFSEVSQLKLSFIEDPSNLIKRYRYVRVRRRLNLLYTPIMKVPNKFNRGIIFPARYAHRAQNFFGTSIESARLTSVSFLG